MKTTFNYDHYFLYQELSDHLSELEKKYPDIMHLDIIGTTPKGRHVYAVTISNGDSDKKPAYYIDGNTHAGEVTGSMAAMHTIDYLVTNYKEDKKVTDLIDRFTFYVIPRISPDGAEAYLTSETKLRSVDRPYLTETQENGLYDDDIDHDGVLRMMRVKTPYGAWKVNPDNPNVMLKRQPDEFEGTFYNVYPEGQVKGFDGDHFKNANPLWGLDFNRNYPFGWFSEVRQPGAGPYPLSNMENKAVVDFVLAHKNIGGVATHHTFGGMILCPPGTRPEKTSSKLDQKILKEIGKMGTEEMGYPVVAIFDSFTEDQTSYSSGAFDDWCYQQNGIPAYTTELWNMVSRAGIKQTWPSLPKTDKEMAEEYQKLIDWCQENAPEAFKPWQTCPHPQFGEVEIGGLDMKFSLQNPPVAFLTQEVEKTTRFCLRMAATLPQLTFDHIDTTKIEEDTYKIEVHIANKGYLPTYLTDETKKMKIGSPVKVELIEEKTKAVSPAEIDLGNLEGFSGVATDYFFDHSINTFDYEPIMKKATFFVEGKSGDTLKLKASCHKGGTIETTITLND